MSTRYKIAEKEVLYYLTFPRTVHFSDDEKRIATVDYKTVENGLAITSFNDIVRYQYDNHLGSSCLELDQTAATISYEEYHPFGTSSYKLHRNSTEVSIKRYRYVGKERDEETGLYYYGARYYAAHIARFVSVDPLQHKYPHYTPYQYAGNKPITFIDMDGLEEAIPDELKQGAGVYSNPGGGQTAIPKDAVVAKNPFGQVEGFTLNNGNGSSYSWNGEVYACNLPEVTITGTSYVPVGMNRQPIDKTAAPKKDIWYTTGGNWFSFYEQALINNPAFYKQETSKSGARAEFAYNIVFRHSMEKSRMQTVAGMAMLITTVMSAGELTAGGISLFSGSSLTTEVATVNTTKNLVDDVSSNKGITIGLGLSDDLANHRGTGAITWKEAGWQNAGLTKVDYGKMYIGDEYAIKEAFRDASSKANSIRFDVTNFDPFYSKPGITNYEFDYILNNTKLLQKTSFIKDGESVFWNNSKFIK